MFDKHNLGKHAPAASRCANISSRELTLFNPFPALLPTPPFYLVGFFLVALWTPLQHVDWTSKCKKKMLCVAVVAKFRLKNYCSGEGFSKRSFLSFYESDLLLTVCESPNHFLYVWSRGLLGKSQPQHRNLIQFSYVDAGIWFSNSPNRK